MGIYPCRWAAAYGDNQVCGCCDSRCALRKGRDLSSGMKQFLVLEIAIGEAMAGLVHVPLGLELRVYTFLLPLLSKLDLSLSCRPTPGRKSNPWSNHGSGKCLMSH